MNKAELRSVIAEAIEEFTSDGTRSIDDPEDVVRRVWEAYREELMEDAEGSALRDLRAEAKRQMKSAEDEPLDEAQKELFARLPGEKRKLYLCPTPDHPHRRVPFGVMVWADRASHLEMVLDPNVMRAAQRRDEFARQNLILRPHMEAPETTVAEALSCLPDDDEAA